MENKVNSLKLIIENVQSIVFLELLLNTFTVITGDNSIGKSTILRALSFLLYGKTGDFFIRDGEKTCRVTLITSEHTIVWEKTRKKGQIYYVDDPEFKNPIEKMSSLSDVEELLKTPLFSVSTIKIGERIYTPQLHKQDDPLFGVSETDQQNYKNITALITEDGLEPMLKKIGSHRRANSTKTDHLLDDLSKVECAINLYDETQFNAVWDRLYILYSDFTDLKEEFKVITHYIDSLQSLNAKCRTLTSNHAGYKKVYDIFIEFSSEFKNLISLKGFIEKANLVDLKVENITLLKSEFFNTNNSVKSVLNSLSIFSIFDKFKTIDKRYNLLIEVKKQLVNFTISIGDLDLKTKWYTYKTVIDKYTFLESVIKSYELILNSFTGITDFFTITLDYFKTRIGLHYLTDYINSVNSLDSEIVKQSDKVKKLQTEKISLEKQLGVCPLCNRSFK